MTNEFEDMGDDQAEFEALGDEFEQRYRPARDWYTDEDVTNGGTAWTPTLEHLFDFMGVKQLQTRDINYLIQRFKLIRCLVPVTYFKEYWYGEKVIENPELERPVVKRDDEGKPVKKKGSDEYEVSKETVSEKVDPVIKRFRMMKKIVENKDGILELKMIEDKSSGQEEEGVNFYLVPVNEEGDKAVIGRKPTQDERDWVKEHYPDAKEETFWALDDHHSESETQEREVFYKTPKAFLRLSKRYWNRLRRRDPDWVIPKEHWVYGGLEHPDRLIPELSDRLINERGDVTIGALNEFEFLHFVKYFADHYFFEAEVRYTWQKLVRANAIRYLSRKGELTDKSLYDYMEEKAYDWWPPDRLIDFVDTMVEDPRRFDREPDPDDPDADFELSHRPAERAWSRFESLSCLRHIVRLPTHRGYKNLDWSNSLIKYLTYEELRDLPNGHFRMSRHGVWVFGTGEYTLADAKRAVGDDWGGRESKGIWGNNWVFSECDKLTPQPEPLPESPTKAEVEAWNTATRARRDLMMAVAGFGPNDQKETVSAFYLAYGSYRENVGQGAGAIRGLLVYNREGTMVTADDFRKNYVTKCRDYDRGEIGILLRQVIFFL
ncbi:hypothetical protein IID21_04450, partial [Patescibacteria group bacterium]|nr:hypothetical protein [Patescibacteria group bacterium]